MSNTPFQGVVTPEAVVLEFETAGVGSRSAAALIDLIIRGFIYLLLVLAAFSSQDAFVSSPGWVGVTVIALAVFALTVGYSVAFETLWNGKTPGKAILGLRVVTTEGAPTRFRHAAIRGGFWVFEVLVTSGVVAVLVAVLNKKNQRLGDLVAGTMTLRERSALAQPTAVQFRPPPEAEEYTSTLDASSLTGEDYATIRSYLLRAPSLQAKARAGLADQIGRTVLNKLNASPPAWMSAEMFLVCAASAYQRRFDRSV